VAVPEVPNRGAPLGRGAKLQVAIHLQVVWGA